MTLLRSLVSRLRALVHRRHRDAELDEEIETHLSLIAGEQMRRGMSPLDLLTFGGVVILFALVAGVACCVPAMRAMRITAMQALRYE